MNGTATINLTELWNAQRDRYASRQGEFILSADVVLMGDAAETWAFLRACGGRIFRVLYVCTNGVVRDMIGRQGVYASKQDGQVLNVGHAMACAERLNLSFWTCVGQSLTAKERAYMAQWFPVELAEMDAQRRRNKVNTGAGYGYRTLKAERILAIRCEGHDILTQAGQEAL